METTSINLGLQPAISPAAKELERSMKQFIAAASTHALPVVGSALLVLGVLLSSGAETITSALISAALVLAGAAVLQQASKKEGGEA